jgi:Dihydroxybiphenyl dioxygenase BphC D1
MLQGLGYAGFGSDRLDDWREFGTSLVGLQAVERSPSLLAFRMDDRKQRIVIDRRLCCSMYQPLIYDVIPGRCDCAPSRNDGGREILIDSFRSANALASQAELFPKRRHFVIAHKLATLGLRKALEHRSAVLIWHNKQTATSGGDLYKHPSNVGLPIVGQPPHLFNGVFWNRRHSYVIVKAATEFEWPCLCFGGLRTAHSRCFLKYSVARPQASSAAWRSCTAMRCSLTKACSAS